MPTPAKATEVSDSKTQTEREVRAAIPNSGIRVPSRPRHYWASVNQPWIICRNIDHFWICRFNNDGLSLRCYRLLLRALQISCLLRALAHYLHCIHYLLLLVHIGVSERRGPGKVLIHIAKHRRKLRKRFDARIPGLLVYLVSQFFAL